MCHQHISTMKNSAGILVFRRTPELEVFLVHPGGPFFRNKDAGWWTIPKGEIEENEDPLQTAIREFREETGVQLNGVFIPLGHVVQKAGKKVTAWAIEQDINADKIVSNTFKLMWPPKSNKLQEFPEIDKACWFSLDNARVKINAAQVELVDRLKANL